MESIIGIWIFDQKGQQLFSHEISLVGSDQTDSALFQGFISSLEKFADHLGKEQIEQIEMGKIKIFLSRDKETKISFIIKTTRDVDNKKASKLLSKIQKDFLQTFKAYFKKYDSSVEEINYYFKKYEPHDLGIYINNLFKTYIEKLLGISIRDKMTDFGEEEEEKEKEEEQI